MYAMICIRPDIAYSVGMMSIFLANPGKEHWEGVKWILRYLKGTYKFCICYGSNTEGLLSFTDSDMAGDIDSMRSTSGYLFTYTAAALSWQSKLQKCVALSTTEVEYIAVTECCKEMLWLKRFFKELGIDQEKFTVFCDSQSAIYLSKNPSFHSKSKHIHIRYHWVREVLEEKSLYLDKNSTTATPLHSS
ncbi:transmembrane signal receptor [Lithospermum erythrorhizon]|uniref:Transmembrane signal receptor n=1 Tax=Lithospermum erythrorhizon TaxID=34254 RepID=A0AAV3RCA0_LITER